MEYKIHECSGFRIAGLKWEGTYNEVPQLKKVIGQMSARKNELKYVKHPENQWGLSFHLIPDGFIHYSGFEVDPGENTIEGLVDVAIPPHRYWHVHHPKGRDIGSTYGEINQWFRDHNETPYVEQGVQYYDNLPLKFERYPVDRDPKDPHFDIFIPIQP